MSLLQCFTRSEPLKARQRSYRRDRGVSIRMAAMYREVVLKEKPAQSQDGFIPLGALLTSKPNGNGAHAPKPEVAEPVAGD